jgi:hypothetical protein
MTSTEHNVGSTGCALTVLLLSASARSPPVKVLGAPPCSHPPLPAALRPSRQALENPAPRVQLTRQACPRCRRCCASRGRHLHAVPTAPRLPRKPASLPAARTAANGSASSAESLPWICAGWTSGSWWVARGRAIGPAFAAPQRPPSSQQLDTAELLRLCRPAAAATRVLPCCLPRLGRTASCWSAWQQGG